LTLNLFFYKFYGDILTKINVFIKYFYKYFKLTLNSTKTLDFGFVLNLKFSS